MDYSTYLMIILKKRGLTYQSSDLFLHVAHHESTGIDYTNPSALNWINIDTYL